MKPVKQSYAKIATISLASVLLYSCAPTRAPYYVAPGFTPTEVNHIALLPAVDHRDKTNSKHDLKELMTERAETSLKKKGYQVAIETNPALTTSVQRGQLIKPSPAWIASLQPTKERWALMLVLRNSKSQVGFLDSEGNAEVEAILFDKKKGIVAWREQGKGTSKMDISMGSGLIGGIVGMSMANKMERDAVRYATDDAVSTLPTK